MKDEPTDGGGGEDRIGEAAMGSTSAGEELLNWLAVMQLRLSEVSSTMLTAIKGGVEDDCSSISSSKLGFNRKDQQNKCRSCCMKIFDSCPI